MKLQNYHTHFQLGELRTNLFRFLQSQLKKLRPDLALTKTTSSVVAELGQNSGLLAYRFQNFQFLSDASFDCKKKITKVLIF